MMKIAWIGAGVMGQSMAGRLLSGGHALTLYSRTKEKAFALITRGAQWTNSAEEAALNADVVCSMVGYPADVEEVFLGPKGALRNMRPGALYIDFTTSSPALARQIFTAAKKSGIAALDAPVSGGDSGARLGTQALIKQLEKINFNRKGARSQESVVRIRTAVP